jgi:hypothetical protein
MPRIFAKLEQQLIQSVGEFGQRPAEFLGALDRFILK